MKDNSLKYSSLILAVSLAIGQVMGRAVADERQLDVLCSGNRAARLSIQTLSCRVVLSESPPGRSSQPVGDYCRTGDRCRVRFSSYGKLLDCLVNDSVVTTLSTGKRSDGREQKTAVIGRFAKQPIGDCDAWYLGLFVYHDPKTGDLVPFDEMLKGPHKVSLGEDDGGLILVNVRHPAVSWFQVWFDPKANYLVRKVVVRSIATGTSSEAGRTEAEVLQFREVAPAIYFPELVERRAILGEKSIRTEQVTFSNIRVNQPLPQDTFQLRLPHGIRILDNIKGVEYNADEGGKAITPLKVLPIFTPLPAATRKQTETLIEAPATTRWLLPVSLCLLAVGVTLWAFRKWRAAA